MSEQTPNEPLVTATKTKDKGQPVTIIDFGGLGTVTFPGWEIPHENSVKGAQLGLQVKSGGLTLKEAQTEAVEIDSQYQQNEPRRPGHLQPPPRNFAQTALSLVAGPVPKS